MAVGALLIGGSIYLLADGGGPGAQEPPTPPNVLVVVTDDQPMGTVRRMPFLSNAPGMTRFDSFYANNPLCCPTRATLLTGLYSHHTGVETNLVADRFDASSTLATWLQARGYVTGLYGKYLNDYPWDKGRTYVPPGWDGWAAFAGDAGYYDYTLVSPGGRRHYGHRPDDYSTDVLARLAADFMRDADRPYFAYFAPYGPHAPRTPALRDRTAYASRRVSLPPNFNKIADRAPQWWRERPPVDRRAMREETRAQWRTLLSVDEAIKRFFSVMRDAGELESTIVICPLRQWLLARLTPESLEGLPLRGVHSPAAAHPLARPKHRPEGHGVDQCSRHRPDDRGDDGSLGEPAAGWDEPGAAADRRVLEPGPACAPATRPVPAHGAELLGNPNREVDVRPL